MSDPIRLICDAISPPLDVDPDEVRFRCQKPADHSGDHVIRLEWSKDPALFEVAPWRTE
jgi:hypothetical protein